MITTHSAPIASGSIARIDTSKNLKVGPQSAGARPGPACFDLGGMEPTVTDADVVLGFIDPNYFLGGRIKLSKAKAETVIKTRIADHLGVSVNEAAWMVREEMGKMINEEIIHFIDSHGIHMKDLTNFAMVVYGGAGPTHYTDFIKDLRFGHSLATPYASVFSAFGSSTTDVLHSYSKFTSIELRKGNKYFSDYKNFNAIINNLKEAARRDIRGEGFSPEHASYSLELMGDGTLKGVRIHTEKLLLGSEQDVKELCTKFTTKGPISISAMTLNARVPMPHLTAKKFKMGKTDSNKAMKTSRQVYWSPTSGYQNTPVYELELLEPGNVVVGPAVVDAKDTTYVIPLGMSLQMDKYSNAIMMKTFNKEKYD
jgi:N-methylhydantoinase A/acetophenone carboxylase